MTAYSSVDSSGEIDQGDIFKDIYFAAIDSHITAVVITPTCDLVQRKAHYVKLVATVPLNQVVKIIADSVGIQDSLFSSQEELSGKKCTKLLSQLERNIDGNFLPRYYLLSEYIGVFPASYVDLQQVFVMPMEQLRAQYLSNRIARMNSPWREQVVAQYSGYSMRVGVQEYSKQEIRSIAIAAGLNLPSEASS